jgi:purine-nucleoside phosphorylase
MMSLRDLGLNGTKVTDTTQRRKCRTNPYDMAEPSNYRNLCDRASRQRPHVAIVLGSGLGGLAERMHCLERVSFADAPGLGQTSVPGHQGNLLLGTWSGQTVLVFAGRVHFYEGQPWSKVEQPVRIARDLGADVLLSTNASGGIRDDLVPGDLMAIDAHVDWTRGISSGDGHRRTVANPYDPGISSLLQDAARDLGMALPRGVYAQVTGPCYETPAEIRALKSLGADAVGMSTANEAKTGFELGMACAGLSCITNRAAGLGAGSIHHDEVLARTAQAKDRIAHLLERMLARL